MDTSIVEFYTFEYYILNPNFFKILNGMLSVTRRLAAKGVKTKFTIRKLIDEIARTL